MALEETTTTTEQTPPPSAAEPTPIESTGSLKDHRDEFPRPDRQTGMRSTQAPEVSAGEKVEKGERHRSRRQDATAKDVPRIQALTGRAKTAEERVTALEAELATLRTPKTETVAAPSTMTAQPPARVTETPIPAAGKEPDASDTTKYPYGAADPGYMRDLVAHTIADERRTQALSAQETDLKRSQEEGRTKFFERYHAAKTEIADFDTIAARPVPWKTGDPIDLWIWARPYGPKLLYYLNHPDHQTETREIMALTVDDQLDRLSLLGQRLSTNAGNGGATGAPTLPTVVVPSPRPPTPVKTGSMTRSSTEPDPSTMSLRQHRDAFPTRRHR